MVEITDNKLTMYCLLLRLFLSLKCLVFLSVPFIHYVDVRI